jgi:beta-glucanase (GH16 family)
MTFALLLRKATMLSLVLLLGVSLAGCEESSTATPLEYQIVWSDEFDGPEGELLDSTKWDYDIGGWGWGNNQLEYNTNRAENVSLDGEGNLAIIAREETFQDNEYTSARIVTRDLYEFAYGRVEARIQLPVGQGIWPAFWMLGADFPEIGWPDCGEIDIMEYLGHQPVMAHGTVHGPGYSGSGGITQSYILSDGRFDTEFHVFSIEWTEEEIRWYIDDDHFHTVTPDDLTGPWVFEHPFYLLLNVAVGGYWPGYPDETTEFPQTMLVDYVRVYQIVR